MRRILALLLALLLPVSAADNQFLRAWEAMSVRLIDYNESTTSVASLATSASITPAANRMYFAIVVCTAGAAISCTGVSGAGLTWVQVGSSVDYNIIATPLSEITVWRSANQAPSSGSVTASFSPNATSCQLAIVEVVNAATTGANGADGIVQATTGSGNAATATTLTAGAAISASLGNIVLACYGYDTTPSMTAESGWTELVDTDINNPASSLSVHYRIEGTDTSSASTISPAGDWGGVIVEVKHK